MTRCGARICPTLAPQQEELASRSCDSGNRLPEEWQTQNNLSKNFGFILKKLALLQVKKKKKKIGAQVVGNGMLYCFHECSCFPTILENLLGGVKLPFLQPETNPDHDIGLSNISKISDLEGLYFPSLDQVL